MSTVKDILERAQARSSFNYSGIVDDGEVVRRVQNDLRYCYSRAMTTALAAGHEPSFFAKEAQIVGVASAYSYPTGCLFVYHAEDASPQRIAIVNANDVEAELAPRLIRVGTDLLSPGGTGDPGATDTIDVYYAMTHPALNPAAALDHANNTFDASWRDHHDEILETGLAAFIAGKDGREVEVSMLTTELKGLLEVFDAEVLSSTFRMSARHE